MEKYLKDNFDVQSKRTSEDALRRWRSAVSVVKNHPRRFRMVADLAKRAEAQLKRTNLQDLHEELIGTKVLETQENVSKTQPGENEAQEKVIETQPEGNEGQEKVIETQADGIESSDSIEKEDSEDFTLGEKFKQYLSKSAAKRAKQKERKALMAKKNQGGKN